MTETFQHYTVMLKRNGRWTCNQTERNLCGLVHSAEPGIANTY